jgi:hypothetical protein
VASAFLRAVVDTARISAITRAEVLTGVQSDDLPTVRALLDRFPLLAIDRPIADLAADLRRRHRWRLPDAFQAAAAQHHGLVLATRNTKDFSPKRHPWVRIPYRV